MDKIAVYHFSNGSGGGVLSVIRNLLLFSNHPAIQNHIIYTINKDKQGSYTPKPLEGAVTESVFYYSPKSNFYFTCKALAKLIPNQQALLITHDWLELGMISHLGLQNPVITFLHGDYDYYYNLAKVHEGSIDKYFAIAGSIADKLKSMLILRSEDVHYLRFPVPAVVINKAERISNSIAFVGRLSADKGYPVLSQVEELLRAKGLHFTWHIAGDFINTSDKQAKLWNKESAVIFYGEISNEEALKLLAKMEYFILPSTHEGMPVTVVEAMKSGVVPIVNNIDGGIQELVEDGMTGYKIKENNPIDYACKIEELTVSESLKVAIQQNCIEKANAWFDPKENTRLIEEQIVMLYGGVRRRKISKAVYGSRLDQKWVPNFITKAARTFR